MVPRSRLAFVILYLAGTEAVLLVLQGLLRLVGLPGAADAVAGWTVFLGWVLAIFLLVRGLRWLRDHVMWSVRNRLIVTYLFIGGVPVTLAVAIGLLSGYLVLGDLAVFIAVSEIKAEASHLGAANAAAEEEITRHSSTPEKIAAADTEFPGRSISVLPVSSLSGWVKDGFSGLVNEKGHIYLRAVNAHKDSRGPAMVVSSIPLDKKLLGKIASKLGSLTLYSQEFSRDEKSLENAISNAQSASGLTSGRISAGTVSEPVMALDREIDFNGLIPVTDWTSGSSRTKII
jgi:sigma-B regulation protein RsbU (phosphoserine phosphatase)